MKKQIVAGVLTLAGVGAHAQVQMEVGAGLSRATARPDGIWYQSSFPHEMKLKDKAWQVGLTGELSKALRWHLDAVSLGSVSSDALATPNDANYAPGSGCIGECLPLVRYVGSGRVAGVAATLEAHTRGKQQVGVELGPFVYYASWNMSVPGWYPSEQMAPGVFTQGERRDLAYRDKHVAIGYVLGLRLRDGPWTLSYRVYGARAGFKGHGNDPWPAVWNQHHVLMVTKVF